MITNLDAKLLSTFGKNNNIVSKGIAENRSSQKRPKK